MAQVFVASTYPLDIVKANRWVEANKELAPDARTEAAEGQGWDPSVAVLAAGFPTVMERMSDDIDWTETLGDAVLAQSDDVLDAVQRMRAQADAMGNLPSNEAQTVTVEGDNIAITPANPEVVYVPTYEPQTVYTTAATAPPAVASYTEPGFSTGALVTTGILAFGAGMLVNEIFDDDDDDWHGYWGPGYYGPGRWVDWNDGNFYPRPGWGGGNFSGNDIDIDIGEVNIDRDRLSIDRDGTWRPDKDRRDRAHDKIADRKGGGDRDGLGRDAGRARPGTDPEREKLKSTLAARSDGGASQIRKKTDGAPKVAPRKADRNATPFGGERGGLTDTKRAKKRGKESKVKASSRRGDIARPAQRRAAGKTAGLGKPKGTIKPQRASSKGSAFNKRSGGGRASAAASRGKASRGGGSRRRR